VERPAGWPGLFIAGTDTGVGKTTFSVALLRHAQQRGRRLVPFKPAETGCDPDPTDAFRLWEAALPSVDRAAVCLYALPLPAAPKAAADHAGVVISVSAIVSRARDLAAHGDALIVEGAGGLLAPYGPGVTGAEVAAATGLPILLVARTALGTINHVALTVNEIRRRGLPLAGIVLVATHARREPHEATNAPLIEELTGVRPIGTFPYTPATANPDRLAALLGAAFSAEALSVLGL
jgi:dethiobiotin synthetase